MPILKLLFPVTLIALVGCSQSASPPATPSAEVSAPSREGAAFRLKDEPEGALQVKAAKESVKDEEEVILVGRIGGDEKPFIQGQSAFSIVDTSLKPCNEKDDDGCPTPWDYCCDTDELPSSKALIKVVGADGKPLGKDARALLGLKELQTVVVRGKAKRDEAGNLVVLADGVFVRK
jgi:hypothetical protein